MKIAIINGPNLNLLGQRDPATYGAETFQETLSKLQQLFPEDNLTYFQSNSEGEIIDFIQKANSELNAAALVINPGAYAHYSYAIADAMADSPLPIVEVHISNIHARDEFRAKSVTARHALSVITGCGREGYRFAIEYLKTIL